MSGSSPIRSAKWRVNVSGDMACLESSATVKSRSGSRPGLSSNWNVNAQGARPASKAVRAVMSRLGVGTSSFRRRNGKVGELVKPARC